MVDKSKRGEVLPKIDNSQQWVPVIRHLYRQQMFGESEITKGDFRSITTLMEMVRELEADLGRIVCGSDVAETYNENEKYVGDTIRKAKKINVIEIRRYGLLWGLHPHPDILAHLNLDQFGVDSGGISDEGKVSGYNLGSSMLILYAINGALKRELWKHRSDTGAGRLRVNWLVLQNAIVLCQTRNNWAPYLYLTRVMDWTQESTGDSCRWLRDKEFLELSQVQGVGGNPTMFRLTSRTMGVLQQALEDAEKALPLPASSEEEYQDPPWLANLSSAQLMKDEPSES